MSPGPRMRARYGLVPHPKQMPMAWCGEIRTRLADGFPLVVGDVPPKRARPAGSRNPVAPAPSGTPRGPRAPAWRTVSTAVRWAAREPVSGTPRIRPRPPVAPSPIAVRSRASGPPFDRRAPGRSAETTGPSPDEESPSASGSAMTRHDPSPSPWVGTASTPNDASAAATRSAIGTATMTQ